MTKKILILGIGNILLCDEGFGPAAIYFLQKHYQWPDNVRLLDGATSGLMLMGDLLECDLAVVLDIVLGGEKPGTFYKLGDEDLDKSFTSRYSMHQTGLTDILISCELAGHRPATIVFGMEPYDYQRPQASLSPQAERQLPIFCQKAVDEMRALGLDIKKTG